MYQILKRRHNGKNSITLNWRIPSEGFKICSRCDKELPATTYYFQRNSSSQDGLKAACKSHKTYVDENKRKISQRNWAKLHPELVSLKSANRRCSKLLATPKWSECSEIREFYKNRPEGFQVDHIVPLVGKPYEWQSGEITPKVCGLHVLANLQYLTASENLLKHNELLLN